MSLSRFVISLVLAGLALAGCAKPPEPHMMARSQAPLITNSILQSSQPITQQPMPERIFSTGTLGGRTLAVASTTDIILRPGEVVLTFDDGPRPGKTTEILATLDRFGVKATFLMLGSAAQAHPALAQQVAAQVDHALWAFYHQQVAALAQVVTIEAHDIAFTEKPS